MPLLTCKDYVKPILVNLRDTPTGMTGTELTQRVAENTGLSDADAAATISDGTPRYAVRIKQARYWLKNQAFVASLPGGRWSITQAGLKFLRDTGGQPESLARAEKPATTKPRRSGERTPATLSSLPMEPGDPPEETIDTAIREMRSSLAADLLQRLIQTSPGFFERAVLQLLRAMGYVGDLGFVEHTGGPGDGGIDGILNLDRLGLERVYVQAKKWKDPVGEPELRQFCGALSIRRAQKGVLITTSSFTDPVHKATEKAPQTIRLIGGKEMVELMIEFGVGVTLRSILVPKLVPSFFDE